MVWSAPRHELLATAPQTIGRIQTAIGSVTVTRASGFVVQANAGELVYLGDVIETDGDGSVGISFTDGTAFNLSASARMVLNEFVCDPGGTSSSALFSVLQGAFAFIAGKLAKTGGLQIDTPVARIRGSRGGGIGILTLAALTFAVIDQLQAKHEHVTDDDEITGAGSFVLTTKEAIPRDIVVDDPWKTIILRLVGSTVRADQVTNSPERMTELGRASEGAAAVYQQGQADAYIQLHQRADLNAPGSAFASLTNSDAGIFGANVGGSAIATAETPPVTLAATIPSAPPPPPPPVVDVVPPPSPIVAGPPPPPPPPPPTNTPATIGGTSGAGQEDGPVPTGAAATVSDPDAGQSDFQGPPAGSYQGTYGTFTWDPATGAWTYALDNSAPQVQALRVNQQVTDSMSVISLDGTTSQITVNIGGTNDAPVLNPTNAPTAVPEQANASAQDLAITGSFSVTDADVGDTLSASVVGGPVVLLNNQPFLLPAGAAALTTAAFTLTGATSNGGAVSIGYGWDPAGANLDFLGAGDSSDHHLHGCGQRRHDDLRHAGCDLQHHRYHRRDGIDFGRHAEPSDRRHRSQH